MRLIRSLLFDVEPTDPITLAGAAFLLVAVTAMAAYLPARRASRVDPLFALSHD
jgi:ABC-type lipoprotein release transport system permease subunit